MSRLEKDSASIDFEKVKAEARFDGKWVLRTNTDLPTEKVALKYKELWQVERVFRDVKSMLETRPIFHQRDDTIRGHVFCSFLALVLRKELERHLEKAGHVFEWSHIKQDLQALQETHIEENGNQLAIRSKAEGVCGKAVPGGRHGDAADDSRNLIRHFGIFGMGVVPRAFLCPIAACFY